MAAALLQSVRSTKGKGNLERLIQTSKNSKMKELETLDPNYSIVGLKNADQFSMFGNEVKSYIEQHKLSVNIKGNPYAMVEGWQFALGLLGIVAKTETLEDLGDSTIKLFKYKAHVTLYEIATGKVFSSGIAICSNQEKKKEYFEEYAIASMAQTRALGRAARISLGWIMKASGYSGTPAEDMEQVTPSDKPNITDPMIIDQYKRFALKAIQCCEKASHVGQLSNIAKLLHEYPEFIDAARLRHSELAEIPE